MINMPEEVQSTHSTYPFFLIPLIYFCQLPFYPHVLNATKSSKGH